MIYQTAVYKVKAQNIAKIKKAIKVFTKYVKENEPGTLMYLAWQKSDDPETFMHFFIFKDKKAQSIHGKSEEVKIFESIYSPTLISKGVDFTSFTQIASNF